VRAGSHPNGLTRARQDGAGTHQQGSPPRGCSPSTPGAKNASPAVSGAARRL